MVPHGMTDKQMIDFFRDNTDPNLRMQIPGFIKAIAAFRTETEQEKAIKPLQRFGSIIEDSMLEGEEVIPFTGCTTQ
jgi:hypothetical protein